MPALAGVSVNEPSALTVGVPREGWPVTTAVATIAQEELGRCVAARTGAGLTRVIQKLFERHADLFAIRPQGGAYFCPAAHAPFVDRVQALLGRLNGPVLRFPVSAGTPERDRSVKESVAAGLAAVANHRALISTPGARRRCGKLRGSEPG